MPLNGSNKGTHLDLSPSSDYCIHCFSEGDFVIPNLTLEQQIQRLTDIAVEKMGMDRSKAQQMAESTLPQLKRWK